MEAELAELRSQLVETRAQMLLQEIGLYEYIHPLDSSAQYKDVLIQLRAKMAECVKRNAAVASVKRWAINGSDQQGAKMVVDFSKLVLRAYNAEAEAAVKSLRPYSLDATLRRLEKLRSTISKLSQTMNLGITDEYHGLRKKELELTADYLAKVAEEKEAAAEERARLREEKAARLEFEREQAKLDKERSHYRAAIEALEARGDIKAAEEARKELDAIDKALQGVIDRAANVRAGYVYVISNRGAFGEGVVKIGMTRRLQPLDRVHELGDASVPFRFDVHALIFSEDAVGLETALHQRFATSRVNLVNNRREFFYTSPAVVKAALLVLRGDLLTFTEEAEALEWYQSEATRRSNNQVTSGSQSSPAI